MALGRALVAPVQPHSQSLMGRRATHDVAKLEEAIGHRFKDRTLLEMALTHISALTGTPAVGPHYQRLEFLGDRVLGLVAADLVYRRFPDIAEGALSRRFNLIVRKETCAEVAEGWNVPPYIRLGTGEKQSGLRKKAALLGDVCEAIIAAVYLDGGFDAAFKVVETAFAPKLTESGRVTRDPKSRLQEWAMGQGMPAPVYRLVERTGPDHAPVFIISAELPGYDPVRGEGASKKLAEQKAARAFMTRENVTEEPS